MKRFRRVGELIRISREAHHLTRGQLAAAIGYRNLAKGSRRIHQAEIGEGATQTLVESLIARLDLDLVALGHAYSEDEREYHEGWSRWADTPIRPYLVLRLIPGFYSRTSLPENVISLEEAEAWVSAVVRFRHMRGCLVWTRRLSVWFEPDGSVSSRTKARPDVPNEPWMQLGRRSFSVTISEAATGSS